MTRTTSTTQSPSTGSFPTSVDAEASFTSAEPPPTREGTPAPVLELAPDRGEEPDWERLDPRGWYALFGKRALTVLLLAVILPLAAVLCLPIALVNWAIFRDARRILYHQPRVGYHGRLFSIVKFRTMRETSTDAFASWKEGSDGLRVTGFGRFLRNTHLDELPQILNILRGEMDFIGPRPEMIEIYHWACDHVPRFRDRHAMLPGITGYAQITQGYTGMDPRAYRRKLAADLLYLERQSLAFDLEILARTALWMVRGRGWRWRGRAAVAAKTDRESSAA